MLHFPDEFTTLTQPFAFLFSRRVFSHARLLLAGAILATGKRTVAALLRVLGLSREKNYHKYHRVLSLARWSALQAARVLLGLLLDCFLPQGPVVVALDETLERRWGRKIEKRGIYRDSVRSSGSHFVKSSGLRRVCVMLLVPIHWARRVWALPFLSVLAPSKGYADKPGKKHKKLSDWARQLLLLVKRWLPERMLVVVADSSYAVMELLASLQGVTMITPLRLDAALYGPVPEREPGKPGRNRKKGNRLPSLNQVLEDETTEWQKVKFSSWYGQEEKEMEVATGTALWYHPGKPVVELRWVLLRDVEGKQPAKALLSTDTALTPEQILSHYVGRWSVEVTLEEARAHLGVETQRQWSAKAIERSTPVLLALFSVVSLLAHQLQKQGKLHIATTAWYQKQVPTFSDALAAVKWLLWEKMNFSTSADQQHVIKIPKQWLSYLQHVIAHAA